MPQSSSLLLPTDPAPAPGAWTRVQVAQWLGSGSWARGDVEMWLKICFRTLQAGTAIIAPSKHENTLVSTWGSHTHSRTFDIAAFAGTVLGRRSPECRAVLTWARTVAVPLAGDCSIAEFCHDTGWSRATFDRARIRACEVIAAAKNHADAREEIVVKNLCQTA